MIWSYSVTDISYMVLLLANCSGSHVMCGCAGMGVTRVKVMAGEGKGDGR